MEIYRIGGLPDWGIYRFGIYQIGARQSVGVLGIETPIGSAIVAMAAAIATIANVVMAGVVEPQKWWS